jgi:hypothetical protein
MSCLLLMHELKHGDIGNWQLDFAIPKIQICFSTSRF